MGEIDYLRNMCLERVWASSNKHFLLMQKKLLKNLKLPKQMARLKVEEAHENI